MPVTLLARPLTLVVVALSVVGCSGGSDKAASSDKEGSDASSSAPAPAPKPQPEQTPASAPQQGDAPPAEETWASRGVTFDPVRAEKIRTSSEFRAANADCNYVGCASSGAAAGKQSHPFELHNLHEALSSGLTGAGKLVAVVDSGFRLTHQEFAGKTILKFGEVHSSDHGTHVASLVAGVQDGKGMHGVAPKADLHLMGLNPKGGTALNLDHVTRGTLDAATKGAVAQNNSWGFKVKASDLASHMEANPGSSVADGLNALIGNYGSTQWQAYLDALDSFQKGGVVVWGLSNDETMSSGDVMSTLPYFDKRLKEAWITAANGYFEVDAAGELTKAVRLSAPCGYAAEFCVAGDGTTAAAGASSDSAYGTGTGTSFVAPQIAGTIALLAEAFPDMTPEEWTKRVLASADNSWFKRLGIPVKGTVNFGNGVSHAYSQEWGHGVLDIAAALSPIGSVSYLSGDNVLTSERTDLAAARVVTPQSFGDGLNTALAETRVAVFDALNRGFSIEGSQLVGVSEENLLPDLMRWSASPASASPLASEPVPLYARGSYVLAAGISQNRDAMGLLSESYAPMTLGEGSVLSLVGENVAATVTQDFGGVTVTTAGFLGEGQNEQPGATTGGGVNIALGKTTRVDFGVSYIADQTSLLGLESSRSFNWGTGSNLGAVHLGLSHELRADFSLFGRFEYGAARTTGPVSGMVAGVDDVEFSAFQFGASLSDVLSKHDRLTFSVSQPLRIEQGQMRLNLPVGRNATGAIQHEQLAAGIEPNGRELDFGISYDLTTEAGHLRLGALYRADAGHVSGNHAVGAVVGFSKSF